MIASCTPRPRALAAAVAVAAALLLSTVGCTLDTSASTAGGQDSSGAGSTDHITIATPTPAGAPAGVPVWIGKDNGYFADENLSVDVVSFPGQPANAVAAVVAGKADLVISAPDALIVPTANGQDLGLKWIFTPYQAPTFAIAVSPDSPIRNAADLAGKRVAMPSTGVPFQTFLNANISGEGGDPSGVKIITAPAAASLQALQRGDVDAVVSNPNDLAQTEAVAGIHTTTLPLAPAVAKDFGAGFLMRADSTPAQQAVYTKYLRAYLKSALFAKANPAAAVKMNWDIYPAAKPTDQSEDQATAAAQASLQATVNLFVPATNGTWGYIAPSRWAAHIADLGLTSKIADPSVLYDNSMLDKIADFDPAQVKADAQREGK